MGYARVLRDKDGKPSGYRECDGEVAFMPEQQSYERIFRRIKIDLNTMEVLNSDFIKDKQSVYRRGILLRGIKPENFRVLNAVFTGNEQVVYTPFGNAKIAHPSSFEVLDVGMSDGRYSPHSYGRDEEFAYFYTSSTDTPYAIKVKACKDPKEFSVLSRGYAKDDRHVYLDGVVLKGADPAAFTILEDGYARDDKHVYRVHLPLKKAKPATFVVLGDGYSRDDKHVYLWDRLTEADAGTIEVLERGYARDGNHLYYNGNIVEEEGPRQGES